MPHKSVVGLFQSKEQAEKAANDLRNKGFTENEISVVAKDDNQQGREEGNRYTNQRVGDGTAMGAGIGGAAGLLASAGALAIPGIGPILAIGPLAATLTGAVGGGIAGGLVDFGIPEERGRHYEEQVKQGRILAAIKTSDNKVEEAARILRQNGAQDVETH